MRTQRSTSVEVSRWFSCPIVEVSPSSTAYTIVEVFHSLTFPIVEVSNEFPIVEVSLL